MFELLSPWMLLLLPLPYLIWRFFPEKEHNPEMLYAPGLASNQQAGISRTTKPWYFPLLLSAIWLCLILASTQPFWVGDEIELPSKGRDLMLAVDLSGSMKQKDMRIAGQTYQRIDALKYVLNQFIDKRKGDRLGLIVFGTYAYLHSPISYDRTTTKQFLQEAQLGFAGDKTSIGDAIGLAVKKLQQRDEESRVLILVTDGSNTSGSIEPEKAAELAAVAGVKIYTISMASHRRTNTDFFNFISSIPPSVELDERTLEFVATTTGGKYFRATNPQELQEIYEEINQLEPVDQDAETVLPKDALFKYPLAIAFFCSLLLAFLHFTAPIFNNFSKARVK